MNKITIAQKEKNKHLEGFQIEYIVTRIRDFEKECRGKKRNTGKTQFMRELAAETGASLSSVYRIRKLAAVTLQRSDLTPYEDYSAQAVVNLYREGRKRPNRLKLEKAGKFIEEVTEMLRKAKEGGQPDLTSLDEAIHALRMDHPGLYDSSSSVCTKTFYTYIRRGLVSLKPADMPRMASLRRSGHASRDKLALAKGQKGTSIDFRPDISDRSEFGHWEGDLVTGPRDGRKGALLTLIERRTHAYIMMRISSKSAQNVLDCVNHLAAFFGDRFPSVFRSVTFDNGSEFAKWREMETDPETGKRRTCVYFAHPYCSFERGSNENCNGLVRRFIKKGADIGAIPKETIEGINRAINRKRRKINGYLSSDDLFRTELEKLGIPAEKADFYEFISSL